MFVRPPRRSVARTFVITLVASAGLVISNAPAALADTVTNQVSENPVTVDGMFTGGLPLNSSKEWGDVTPLAFHSPTQADPQFRATGTGNGDMTTNSALYTATAEEPGDGDPTSLYLMYDYLPRTDPNCNNGDILADVNFPFTKPDGTRHIVDVLVQCSTGTGTSAPNRSPRRLNPSYVVIATLDDGSADTTCIQGAAGFGDSPLAPTTPHLLVELEVPLSIPPGFGTGTPFPTNGLPNGCYSPAPAFWVASFTNNSAGSPFAVRRTQSGDPQGSGALFQIKPDGSTTADSAVLPNQVVKIDIKPGVDPNDIHLGAGGGVTVAVFGSSTFDASKIDASTVRFAGAAPHCAHLADVNGDGKPDWVVQFNVADLNLTQSSTSGALTGALTGGKTFGGTDSVHIVNQGSNESLCGATSASVGAAGQLGSTSTGTLAPPGPSCTAHANSSTVALSKRGKHGNSTPKPGTLSLTALCSEDASLTLAGVISENLGKHKGHKASARGAKKPKSTVKTIALASVTGSAKAGVPLVLTFSLPKAALKGLKKRGVTESASFTLTASNVNGMSTATAKVAALKGSKVKRH